MMNLLLAEHNFVLREGIKALLSRYGGFKVVAEAATRDELLVDLQSGRIDVLLLDPHLGGVTGEGLIRRVRSVAPKVPILGFGDIDEFRFGTRAIRAGLKGYIKKSCDADEFMRALGLVSEGRPYFSVAMAEQLVDDLRMSGSELPHLLLTERELEIFHRLIRGERIGRIASELSLSVKTISTHKVRLLRKMRLLNISGLVRYAVTHHLV